MKRQQVTITLSGPAGAGKTILARHLANYLHRDYGFEVTWRDDFMGRGEALPIPDRVSAEIPEEFDCTVLIQTKETGA